MSQMAQLDRKYTSSKFFFHNTDRLLLINNPQRVICHIYSHFVISPLKVWNGIELISVFVTYSTCILYMGLYCWNRGVQGMDTYYTSRYSVVCNYLSMTSCLLVAHHSSYIRLVGWRQPHFNTLRPKQNGHHFADDNFKRIFLNENIRISIEISLRFFPKGRINIFHHWFR